MDQEYLRLLKLQVQCLEAYVEYLQGKARRKKRRMAVRPLYQKRRELGDGHNLVEEMRLGDTEMLFNYTRLNSERFEYLLALVGPSLRKRKMSTVITESQRLAMTLRFLAAGDSQDTLAFAYRCGQSTVSGILSETVQVLIDVLEPLVLQPPSTPAEWEAIAAGFWYEWNFPNCVGAIDGKHVQIQCPKASGSLYFNYKKFFSIVLLGVCDADYNFILIDIGAEGSLSDGGIFKQSEMGKRFEEGSMRLPPPCPLPQTDREFPYVLVADAAFQLSSFLMKPYGGQRLTMEQSIFNYRLSRARRVIENAFGILSARWRIFRRPICATEQTVQNIILAAVALHNFILQTGDREVREAYVPSTFLDRDLADTSVPGDWRQVVQHDGNGGALQDLRQAGSHNHRQDAKGLREKLKDYFSEGVGEVPWQRNVVRIRRGELIDINGDSLDKA